MTIDLIEDAENLAPRWLTKPRFASSAATSLAAFTAICVQP